MTETYTIRPLEWIVGEGKNFACSSAETIMGRFVVKGFLHEPWHWYFEENGEMLIPLYPCDSLAHGKQLAEAYWRERIMQALVKVEQ